MTCSLRKRPIPLHALDEEDLSLDFAHRWWRARRRGGLLPPRSAVDTPEFRLLVSGSGWIDVRSALAEQWELGPLLPSPAGLTAEAASAVAVSLRQDLQAIHFTGAVLVQDLILSGPAGTSIWRQLVLPHADDGIRVRELLVMVGTRRVSRQRDASSSSASAGSTPG